ncbi:MAG: hypothetical protein DRN06_04025 [Thermoprotei archaeon]|nr:MAG: hypothetical protein DRN06_04025 [Thermoprotei archaeon]
MGSSSLLERAVRDAVIVCPLCRGILSLERVARRGGVVKRARLHCTSCNAQFRVYARVPVLLPPGQFARWTLPIVEALTGNTGISYEELLAEYGVEKVRELCFKLVRGEYRPSKLLFKEPVDKRLLAEGGRRVVRKVVEKHLKLIRAQTEGSEDFAVMIELASSIAPSKALDMCSGGGFFLARFLERYRGFDHLFSIDVDYHCAKRVEGTLRYYRLLDRALPLVANARIMPFQSSYFDLVTNNCGFSQILGYSRALHEAFRVLRPGGRMVVRDIQGITRWDSSELRSTIGFTVEELVSIHKHCDIYVDKEEFLTLARRVGFHIEGVWDFDEYFIAVLEKP